VGDLVEEPQAPGAVEPASVAPSPPPDAPRSISAIRSASGWLYAVAALTAVNGIALFGGADLHMLIGLSSAQVALALASLGALPLVVAIGVVAILIGAFAFLGLMASRRKPWAFIVAMCLYAADLALTLWLGDWIGAAFHAGGLAVIFMGFRALSASAKPVFAVDGQLIIVSGRASNTVSVVVGWALIALAGVGSLAVLVLLGPAALDMADPDASGLAMLAPVFIVLLPLMLTGLVGYVGFRFLKGSGVSDPT
jgi:hypothetical protein